MVYVDYSTKPRVAPARDRPLPPPGGESFSMSPPISSVLYFSPIQISPPTVTPSGAGKSVTVGKYSILITYDQPQVRSTLKVVFAYSKFILKALQWMLAIFHFRQNVPDDVYVAYCAQHNQHDQLKLHRFSLVWQILDSMANMTAKMWLFTCGEAEQV